MREIKFRAWSGNMMLDYGDANIYSPNRYDTEFEIKAGVEHRDYILMQYTGLKDKNGKEIYEGDIINLINESPGGYGIRRNRRVVEWRNGLNTLGFNLGKGRKGVTVYEVIGNIYENPNLLE